MGKAKKNIFNTKSSMAKPPQKLIILIIIPESKKEENATIDISLNENTTKAIHSFNREK